jgi:hypothetical protein
MWKKYWWNEKDGGKSSVHQAVTTYGRKLKRASFGLTQHGIMFTSTVFKNTPRILDSKCADGQPHGQTCPANPVQPTPVQTHESVAILWRITTLKKSMWFTAVWRNILYQHRWRVRHDATEYVTSPWHVCNVIYNKERHLYTRVTQFSRHLPPQWWPNHVLKADTFHTSIFIKVNSI